ncbi:hypothetical protein ACOJQI_14210 [Bacillus salacetis]|uniref:hypothetical protein n=1 Tax=Bacillus salacetis TaxID=2315464 RepID=UPI003BA3257D
METNYEELLNIYKRIWNHRDLQSKEKEAAVIVKEAVLRELKDENSHPRVRKSKEIKYYFAVKRIMESSLSIEEKYNLIGFYTEQMEELRTNL